MQLSLVHESLADAVAEVAQACGGKKRLAEALWPTNNGAHSHLLDCLNPDRPHKLGPDELISIARIGRERGVDSVARYLNAEMGYEMPKPVDAAVEADRLRTRIADGLDYIRANAARLEQLTTRRA
jgi:hypothetical protein